jgi:hypothetical protein
MRVVKLFFVFGAALLTGGVGYEYAVRSNRLIPNRSYCLPAAHSTCWDWEQERLLIFAEATTIYADGRKEVRLSGMATVFDPVTGETSSVEESDCLVRYFSRRNRSSLPCMGCRGPQSTDGRYVGRRKPTHYEWILASGLTRVVNRALGLSVLQKFEEGYLSANFVLFDEVEHVQLGEIPDSPLCPSGELFSSARFPWSNLSFLHSRQGLVNITGKTVDWYDIADLRCSRRPWLWGIVPPLVVVVAAWTIETTSGRRTPLGRLTSQGLSPDRGDTG